MMGWVGYRMVKRLSESILLEVDGIHKEYKVLEKFEFNSDRKRMSVIAELPGHIGYFLLSKGADSHLLPLANPT